MAELNAALSLRDNTSSGTPCWFQHTRQVANHVTLRGLPQNRLYELTAPVLGASVLFETAYFLNVHLEMM
jgi:hypothetical protein